MPFKKGHKITVGRKHTEEEKKRRTKSIRLAMLRPDVISNNKKRGLRSRGRIVSKETRKKLSELNKGRIFSEEHRKKLSIIAKKRFKGKPKSERTKKNMSLGRKKYLKNNPEILNKQINVLREKIWENPFALNKKGKKLRQTLKRKFKNNPKEYKKFCEQQKEKRAKQVLPIKDTKIEVKIQNFLKQLGITFFTHQYMKIEHGYQCDILIPSINLVIECDGNYWHKYPIGNDIDYIRTKELIKKGFKVLRLWEFEINDMTINQFKIKLKGGVQDE